jgi:hypothetical protein
LELKSVDIDTGRTATEKSKYWQYWKYTKHNFFIDMKYNDNLAILKGVILVF